jgi:hypothetical protein
VCAHHLFAAQHDEIGCQNTIALTEFDGAVWPCLRTVAASQMDCDCAARYSI